MLATQDVCVSNDLLRERLIQRRRVIDLQEVAFAREAAEFAASDTWDEDGSVSAIDWLRFNCHMTAGAAANAVAVGEILDQLPESHQAVVDGEIGFAHLAVMALPESLGGARHHSAVGESDRPIDTRLVALRKLIQDLADCEGVGRRASGHMAVESKPVDRADRAILIPGVGRSELRRLPGEGDFLQVDHPPALDQALAKQVVGDTDVLRREHRNRLPNTRSYVKNLTRKFRSQACRFAAQDQRQLPFPCPPHGSLKKHDSAPVWQAGPAAFTRSRTASRSQSSRTSITSMVFPDVSPFRHSPLSREWNHAWPLSCVCVHASSSM